MQTYLLIAQNCDAYEPIAEVTEGEIDEVIACDRANRSAQNDDLCPESYALWGRGPGGRYIVDRTIPF